MKVSQCRTFQELLKFLQVQSQKPSSAMMKLALMRTATGKEDPELHNPSISWTESRLLGWSQDCQGAVSLCVNMCHFRRRFGPGHPRPYPGGVPGPTSGLFEDSCHVPAPSSPNQSTVWFYPPTGAHLPSLACRDRSHGGLRPGGAGRGIHPSVHLSGHLQLIFREEGGGSAPLYRLPDITE